MLAIFEAVLLAFFATTVGYTLINVVAGFFYASNYSGQHTPCTRFSILIPAYKEDAVIIDSVSQILKQDYPRHLFQVVVIADQLKEKTLLELEAMKIGIIEVHFEKSTKAKSLNSALESISADDFDAVLICDADNILENRLLRKFDESLRAGAKIVQGKRVAKNMDTNLAILDSASEIINNHIFRKGPSAMGLSASLIGSGMAFDTTVVKEALQVNKAVGGFDKVLQLELISRDHKIVYLDDALIFDEKIDNKQNFKNQRRRWLSSQYVYLAKFLPKALKMLFKGNLDYFNMAVLHNLFLPRVLNLGLIWICFITAILTNFVSQKTLLSTGLWGTLTMVYSFCLVAPLPRKFFNKKLLKALISLPTAFWSMFTIMFRLKNADKKFIHTKHTKKSIDNSIYELDNGR